MSILVTCDGCGQSAKVREDLAGKSMRCKACGEVIRVPAASRHDDSFEAAEFDVASPPQLRRASSAGRSNRSVNIQLSGGFIKFVIVIGAVAALGMLLWPVAEKQFANWNRAGDGVVPAQPAAAGAGASGEAAAPAAPQGLVAGLPPVPARTAAAWQEFVHQQGGFRVELPGQAVRIPKMENPGEEVYGTGVAQRFGCLTRYCPLPKAVTVGKTTGRIVEVALHAMESKVPFTERRVISAGDVYGIEARRVATGPDNRVTHNVVRVFYLRGAVVTFEMSSIGDESVAVRDRFFDSIRFDPTDSSPSPAQGNPAGQPVLAGRNSAEENGVSAEHAAETAADRPADNSRRRPPSSSRPQGKGKPTALIGGKGGGPFQTVTVGGPLVGLRFTIGSYGGQKAIGFLDPIFEGVDAGGIGESVTAREGYVVSGLKVDAEKLVNAMQLVFARVDDDGKLDLGDTYTSDWLGTPTGRKVRTIDGKGRPVIGIHGRRAAVLDSIGLVLQ